MLQPREFYKEELSGFFFWWVARWGENSLTTSLTGSPPPQLQPLPRPLSEWRGEWILLVGWERVVRGDRGNCILKLKRRSSRLEKGVSLHWREPFFTPTRRPLYLQTAVFTPLSITSLRSVTAGSERGRGFPLFANNGFHSPLHSERGWGRGLLLASDRLVARLELRLFLFSLDYNKRGGEGVIW